MPARAMLLALLGIAATSPAQRPAEAAIDRGDAAVEAVRTAWTAFAQRRDEVRQLQRPVMQQLCELDRDGDAYREKVAWLRRLRTEVTALQREFEHAFAASTWERFDRASDTELLRHGLQAVASEPVAQPERALLACRALLDRFARDPVASRVRANELPQALLANGQPDEAVASALAAAAAAGDDAAQRARALLLVGDIAAATGDFTVARKRYDDATVDADRRTLGCIALRQRLVGAPAPEIGDAQWIGGAPTSMQQLRGSVVLVDFWASWCGACRHAMPTLDALFRRERDRGLRVVGVTRFYPQGWVPGDAEDLAAGGEPVKDLTEAGYPAHVERFHARSGLSYPFAIATEAGFQSWQIRGLPTLALVGRDGVVALATVGSGNDALVRFAVARALARR